MLSIVPKKVEKEPLSKFKNVREKIAKGMC